MPSWTQEEILISPELYKNVTPVFLAIGLELIHQLLTHPDLQHIRQAIKEDGDVSSVVVSYNNKEIVRLSNIVKESGGNPFLVGAPKLPVF